MKKTLVRPDGSGESGFGFADAIVGIVLLSLAVLLSGSILISAGAAIERAGQQLRTELEARRTLLER